jgi:hypothetical protein
MTKSHFEYSFFFTRRLNCLWSFTAYYMAREYF